MFYKGYNERMARIMSVSFESGTTSAGYEWSSTNGTPTIVTSPVHGGNYAMQIPVGITYITFNAIPSGGNGPYYARCYFYFTGNPSATTSIMSFAGAAGFTTERLRLRMTTTGTFDLQNSAGGSIGTTAAVANNQWHLFEMKFDYTLGGSAGVAELKINGTSVISSSAVNLGGTAIYFTVGRGTASTVNPFYIDDIAVNDTTGAGQTGYPGKGKMVFLRPNAAGDNAATLGTYTAISEITPNDATDYIELDTATTIADYNVENPETQHISPNDTINLVYVGNRGREDSSGTSSYQMRLKSASGGTTVTSTATDQGNTSWASNRDGASANQLTHRLISYTDPTTASAWTATGTNSLTNMQIGVASLTTTDIWFTALWAMVDYTPAANSIEIPDADHTHTADTLVLDSLLQHSYESKSSLPTTEAQLANAFDLTRYEGVATDDNIFAGSAGDSTYNITVFSKRNTNNTDEISLTWRGKTNILPSVATVYLQIYNHNSDLWETIDSDNTTAINTEFELTGGKTTSLSNYYDASNRITARIYQENL